jgi:hypothetical protein
VSQRLANFERVSDMEDSNADIEKLDNVVRGVAALLPFPVVLEADMGGTFVQQILLGTRGEVDDPPDRATIDLGEESVWWFDVEGGRESIPSDFDVHAEPADVASWIADTARRVGSPAASPRVVNRPGEPTQ